MPTSSSLLMAERLEGLKQAGEKPDMVLPDARSARYDVATGCLSVLTIMPMRIMIAAATLLFSQIFWIVSSEIPLTLDITRYLDWFLDGLGTIIFFPDLVFDAMIGILGIWMGYEAAFIIGLITFVAMWICFFGYVLGSDDRTWWYFLTFMAFICFSPLGFDGTWPFGVFGYFVFSFAYWTIPAFFSSGLHLRITSRGVELDPDVIESSSELILKPDNEENQ